MMWKELAEGNTEAQSLTGIIRQTGSDDPELAEDLASFAGQCVDKGLLTLVPDVLPRLEVKKRRRQEMAVCGSQGMAVPRPGNPVTIA